MPTKTRVAAMSNIEAIKTFFGTENPITISELKATSKEDREELGELARAALLEEAFESDAKEE